MYLLYFVPVHLFTLDFWYTAELLTSFILTCMYLVCFVLKYQLMAWTRTQKLNPKKVIVPKLSWEGIWLFEGKLYSVLLYRCQTFIYMSSFDKSWEFQKGLAQPAPTWSTHRLTKQSVDVDPFIIKGSHTWILTCTLSTWLTTGIVDAMNEEFGNVLREELVTLMEWSR